MRCRAVGQVTSIVLQRKRLEGSKGAWENEKPTDIVPVDFMPTALLSSKLLCMRF